MASRNCSCRLSTRPPEPGDAGADEVGQDVHGMDAAPVVGDEDAGLELRYPLVSPGRAERPVERGSWDADRLAHEEARRLACVREQGLGAAGEEADVEKRLGICVHVEESLTDADGLVGRLQALPDADRWERGEVDLASDNGRVRRYGGKQQDGGDECFHYGAPVQMKVMLSPVKAVRPAEIKIELTVTVGIDRAIGVTPFVIATQSGTFGQECPKT